jgi:4-hydroxy-tetrahydrodipicolinate synthase
MSTPLNRLTGMLPAFPTPFAANGTVDRAALSAMVERLIDAGASGLVPVGGTGEYTAMSLTARTEVVALTVQAARSRVPVIAGVLSPGFQEALAAGRAFKDAGAAALLLVTPFYATPTQEGLCAYFSAYARALDLPLFLYDIPGRTGVVTQPSTIARMVDERTIVGMKACNVDIGHFRRTVELVGNDISILSGDDLLFPLHMSLGGHGGILASSTLLPAYWQRISQLCLAGDLAQALALQRKLMPLLDALFAETNPGPLKMAMALAGFPLGPVALPLQAPGEALVARLRGALAELARQGLPDLARFVA